MARDKLPATSTWVVVLPTTVYAVVVPPYKEADLGTPSREANSACRMLADKAHTVISQDLMAFPILCAPSFPVLR